MNSAKFIVLILAVLNWGAEYIKSRGAQNNCGYYQSFLQSDTLGPAGYLMVGFLYFYMIFKLKNRLFK